MPGEPRRSNALLTAIALVECYNDDRRDDCNALVDPLDTQEREDLIAALITTAEMLAMQVPDTAAAIKRLRDLFEGHLHDSSSDDT